MDNTTYLECNQEMTDALLYTVLYNETQRLRVCNNKKERQRIRMFILTGYQELKRNLREERGQETFQENRMQQN